VPGSLDKHLPIYGALLFAIAQFASWPASNNAAIFADVSAQEYQQHFKTPQHFSIASHCAETVIYNM
jgi:hypothetical protein